MNILDMSIYSGTRDGLTAFATKHFLDIQFYGLPEPDRILKFKTNPANNFLYAANDALTERSIVDVVERVKSEDKIAKLPILIPGIEQLKNVRTILSHPGTLLFSRDSVQSSFDAREHYRAGPNAIRLFSIREAVIAKIIELGGEVNFPNKVLIQTGTVELIRGALYHSLASPDLLPPDGEIFKACVTMFAEYENALRNPSLNYK